MDTNIDTKKIFVNSFYNLMKIKNISKISITDIISESNLSRQTFYRYFKDIDDFIYYVHYTNVSPSYTLPYELNNYQNVFKQKRIPFKLYLELMFAHKTFYKQILSSDLYESFSKQYYKKSKENILYFVFYANKEKIVSDELLTFSLDFYTYAFTNTILDWLKSKNPRPSNELAELLIENMPENLKKLL